MTPSRGNFVVLVHPFPPTPSSGAHRWAAVAKYLRRDGHDVRVITSGAFGTAADPAIETGVTRTGDLMASARLRKLVGLAPLAPPDGAADAERSTGGGQPGGSPAEPELPRLLTSIVVPDPFLLSWAPVALVAAIRVLRDRRADCVITSSPNESTHLVGLLLQRIFGHIWIADLRDGWTFERFLPEFPTAVQRRLNRFLERRTLRRADAVLTATRPIAEDLGSRYGITAIHVPNAWDPDLEANTVPVDTGTARDQVRLVHTGKLSGAWGRDPSPLFHALRQLLDEQPSLRDRLRLVIAGKRDTTDARLLDEAQLGEVVSHVGQLPRTEALRLQRTADVLLLVTSPNSGEATGKLYEYLAAGRPILALAARNEAARIISETRTGIAVDPADAAAVRDALRSAVDGGLPYAPQRLDQFRHPAPARRIAGIAADLREARRQGATR